MNGSSVPGSSGSENPACSSVAPDVQKIVSDEDDVVEIQPEALLAPTGPKRPFSTLTEQHCIAVSISLF